MARNENEDLSNFNLPNPDVKDIKDYKCGNVSCARTIINKQTDIVTYFILIYGSNLFDPSNTDIRYKTRNNWRLRRVKKSVYDLYIRFLDTKRKTYLYQAEREI